MRQSDEDLLIAGLGVVAFVLLYLFMEAFPGPQYNYHVIVDGKRTEVDYCHVENGSLYYTRSSNGVKTVISNCVRCECNEVKIEREN